jgi:hypothetical protein
MQRRTLLQLIAAAVAMPVARVRLWAQPREMTAAAIDVLHDIAPTVLPASIGEARLRGAVDAFVAWTRGYREGVATAHGYGHPRLQKTGPSPVPTYLAQLTSLDRAARAKGGRFSTLDLQTRRAILDEAVKSAGVRALPAHPAGQHVVVDLMALYFRSTEANDDCYHAMIQRELCRPIQITIRKPAPKAG